MTGIHYDDTHTRDQQLDRWGPHYQLSTTRNAAEGRDVLAEIRREQAQRLRARRVQMTMKAGVPDAALFGKGHGMAAHLGTLTLTITEGPDGITWRWT